MAYGMQAWDAGGREIVLQYRPFNYIGVAQIPGLNADSSHTVVLPTSTTLTWMVKANAGNAAGTFKAISNVRVSGGTITFFSQSVASSVGVPNPAIVLIAQRS